MLGMSQTTGRITSASEPPATPFSYLYDVDAATDEELRRGFPDPEHRYTLDQYFRWDAVHHLRLEFYGGEIRAMAGGTPQHAMVAFNLAGMLRNALRGTPCRGMTSDAYLHNRAADSVVHPDLVVVCGDIELVENGPNRYTIANPQVVIEVLSPSTKLADRTEKFEIYQRLESFREYVIVDIEAARVETFIRNDDGSWQLRFFSGKDAVARLNTLDVDLPLEEIFEGVEPAPAEQSLDRE